jgi:mannose-6-phosphate isomerase-like protein (cupin superfamily)
MNKEKLAAKKGTCLRKNDFRNLIISINKNRLNSILIINGASFLTENILNSDLIVKPNNFYMIINNGNKYLEIEYDQDITEHKVIYYPYKFENLEKKNFSQAIFIKNYKVPDGYIDVLPKWYSFKFMYPGYNLIFIRPGFGLSIQVHRLRKENWEILDGNPIVISGNSVYYFVEKGSIFCNNLNTYHSIVNPNSDPNKFVMLKERWDGHFDEKDIVRIFNPNQYYD